MCNINDANTHEKLAKIHQEKGNLNKSYEHYLEAASIYTLVAAQEKNTIVHRKANESYQQAHKINGIEKPELTISELARATLIDLDHINQTKTTHMKNHHHVNL